MIEVVCIEIHRNTSKAKHMQLILKYGIILLDYFGAQVPSMNARNVVHSVFCGNQPISLFANMLR